MNYAALCAIISLLAVYPYSRCQPQELPTKNMRSLMQPSTLLNMVLSFLDALYSTKPQGKTEMLKLPL